MQIDLVPPFLKSGIAGKKRKIRLEWHAILRRKFFRNGLKDTINFWTRRLAA
jgi:hypothetical protein